MGHSAGVARCRRPLCLCAFVVKGAHARHKAGHDYLRQMCDESRYMVIEDITALPRELPKIYQRVVRT